MYARMKHVLRIKGADVELTTDEAMKLLAELQEVFGKPVAFSPMQQGQPSGFQNWPPIITRHEPPRRDPLIPERPRMTCHLNPYFRDQFALGELKQ
jgi:hypothetical protein